MDKSYEEKKKVWDSIKPDKEPDWMNSDEPEAPFTDLSSEKAEEIIKNEDIQVVDVRFDWEYNLYHIPEAILIPLPQLETRFIELDPEKKVMLVCEHGIRSADAACYLNIMGMDKKNIYNLESGMSGYKGKVEKQNKD